MRRFNWARCCLKSVYAINAGASGHQPRCDTHRRGFAPWATAVVAAVVHASGKAPGRGQALPVSTRPAPSSRPVGPGPWLSAMAQHRPSGRGCRIFGLRPHRRPARGTSSARRQPGVPASRFTDLRGLTRPPEPARGLSSTGQVWRVGNRNAVLGAGASSGHRRRDLSRTVESDCGRPGLLPGAGRGCLGMGRP